MTKRIISLITVISLIMCLLTSCAMINKVENALGISKIKYKKAMKLIDDGDLQSAYDILSEIKEYKPAKEELDKFHYVITTRSSVHASLDGKAVRSTITYQYDEGGRIAQMKSTGPNGTVTTTDYEYDEHGNVIRYTETTVIEGREPTTSSYEYEYEYDESGRILSKTTLTDEGEKRLEMITYTYDEQDRLVHKKILYLSWGNTYNYAYDYDDAGNLIKELQTIDYGQGQSETVYSYEYTYNEDGHKSTKTYYAYGYTYTDTYTYDGAYISRAYQLYDSDDYDDEWCDTLFSYDENGNLIGLSQTTSSNFFIDLTLSYDDNNCCVSIIQKRYASNTITYTAEYKLIYVTGEVDEEMYSDIFDVLPEY